MAMKFVNGQQLAPKPKLSAVPVETLIALDAVSLAVNLVNSIIVQIKHGTLTVEQGFKRMHSAVDEVTLAATTLLPGYASPLDAGDGEDVDEGESEAGQNIFGGPKPRRNNKNKVTDQAGFERYAVSFGLQKSDFGRKFRLGRSRSLFQVYGIATNRPKNCVMIRRVSTGTEYICKPEQVK